MKTRSKVRSRRGARWWVVLAVAFIGALVHFIAVRTEMGEQFELSRADDWMALRGAQQTPDDVVIVAMDEDSYDELGLSPTAPWPRALHARLLEKLRSLGARRIVFDVLFVGAGTDGAADEALARAVISAPVVLGAELEERDAVGYAVTSLVTPYAAVAAGAAEVALVNLPEDEGTVRSFFVPGESDVTEGLRSLAVAAAGRPETTPNERALINFYGPAGRGIRSLSYYQVLEPEVPLPEEFVRDKIVLVGLMLRTETGPAQKDSFLTPFGRMFGVEIHATAAANIGSGSWIKRADRLTELGILSATALVVGCGVVAAPPVAGAVLLVGAVGAWVGVSALALSNGWFVPGAVLFFIVVPILYTASTIVHYVRSRRERRELARAFSFYLAPAMVEELARDPAGVKLGGDLVEATAVFTDLADFTAISEALTPAALVAMLNDYFTVGTRVVHAEGGTLIKFIGDAMFVVWGAPLPLEDHASRAVRAALQMQRALAEFNVSGRYPPLHMRIGLNTGGMVVGNVGAETRFDYTAMGDAVNLASRVEGLNKYFGTSILATAETVQAAGYTAGLEMGTVGVKGKENRVSLYAIFESPIAEGSRVAWAEALALFRGQRWAEADEAFQAIKRTEPRLDRAAHLYRTQIARCRNDGVSAGWRGEIDFESK